MHSLHGTKIARPLRPSQRSLHNAPIFRLLLKVAVKGTHQCDLLNFCGGFWSPTSVWYWSCCWLLLAKLPRQHGIHMATRMAASATARAEARTIHTRHLQTLCWRSCFRPHLQARMRLLSLHLPRLQQLHILLLHRGSIAYASGLADTHRLLRCTATF